jgi:predicted transcriptional regulator
MKAKEDAVMSTLTPGELEVMRILWEHGVLKPAEIQEKFPHPIQNAALRFQLKILLEKGHVTRRKDGKAYAYQAVTPREGALAKMTRRMADMFCRGSAVGLIAEMIKSEKLTPDQVRELQQYAVGRKESIGPKKSARPKQKKRN